MRRWPEHDRTERVESETHKNGGLVALAFQNLSSDGREAEVTTAEVNNLKAG